ncbi:putative ABC transporter permease subunit [Clostridium sp. DJ247]|uniref:putative ABC transporter permease subunit n=1 Tax=Clostridium sp. DJ247 TaxID=2726188 RepID=UPI001626275B|nr:transporter [Clostridium sp. DJ247]MBC2581187.1 transporter [Clostridium sp. DJ247]
MNKYMILTNILLKNGNKSFVGDIRKRIKTAALFFILVMAFIPSIMLLITFVKNAYDVLQGINQQGIIIAMGISFVNIIIFFFGIFYSNNVLYFTKDIDNLLPLPLKPWQILGAKFTVALFYEYITELVVLLPLIGVYGIKSNAGILFYIYCIILFLTIPIIPLGIASIINMIIMSFTNVGKHKDIFKIAGGILAMFLAVGFNIFMQKAAISGNHPEQLLKMLTEGNNSLVIMSNKVFPGSIIAARAIILSDSYEGIISLLLFLIITVSVTFVFLALGQKLYFRGVIGISESSSKRKELSELQLNKSMVSNSPLKSLIIRETRILVRTPIFFMNCIMMNFLWPIFLIIPLVTQPELLKSVIQVSAIVRDPKLTGIVAGASIAASIFLSSSNLIAATAISREGQNIFVSKFIPVSFGTQIMAKVLTGVLFGLVSIVMIIVISIILIKPPTYLILTVFIAALPGTFFSSFVGIFIDLNFPKLNWDNEVKAVKQNLNGVIALFIGIIIAAILGFFIITVSSKAILVSMLAFIILTIIDYLLYKVVMSKGVGLFKNIEI